VDQEVYDAQMVNATQTATIKMPLTAKANKWFNVQEHFNVLIHMKPVQPLSTAQ